MKRLLDLEKKRVREELAARVDTRESELREANSDIKKKLTQVNIMLENSRLLQNMIM